jgi:hypothetical protein
LLWDSLFFGILGFKHSGRLGLVLVLPHMPLFCCSAAQTIRRAAPSMRWSYYYSTLVSLSTVSHSTLAFTTPPFMTHRGNSSADTTMATTHEKASSSSSETTTTAPTSTTTTTMTNTAGLLQSFVQPRLVNSWVRQLQPETAENLAASLALEHLPANKNDNRHRRPVSNGHYVLVEPTALAEPELLLYSPSVAKDYLQLSHELMESTEMLQWMAGHHVVEGETWATPYALSIMGKRYTSNCPYGTCKNLFKKIRTCCCCFGWQRCISCASDI